MTYNPATESTVAQGLLSSTPNSETGITFGSREAYTPGIPLGSRESYKPGITLGSREVLTHPGYILES